jgi:urea transport system permease protein
MTPPPLTPDAGNHLMRAFCDRVLALVAALCAALCLFAAALPAHAQSFEDALARFAADSFNDTEAAIGQAAASGHAMAQPVIQALQEGRLLFDGGTKRIYIRDQAGKILDAATGQPAADPPGNLKPVRLNNRLRRAVEAALGGLTLLAPDPQKRFEAAQAVFKSRDAGALATLDTAIARETDPRVKRALSEAKAARCCCSPRSGSPSRSASWASSTWRTARWSCSAPTRPSWSRR